MTIDQWYPDHAKALKKAGLKIDCYPTLKMLWSKIDEPRSQQKKKKIVEVTEIPIFALLILDSGRNPYTQPSSTSETNLASSG